MNRRKFLKNSVVASASFPLASVASPFLSSAVEVESKPKVSVLLVDTDRVATRIHERISWQFLEHINHSVEDGPSPNRFGAPGFEGEDFDVLGIDLRCGEVEIANLAFQNGSKSV